MRNILSKIYLDIAEILPKCKKGVFANLQLLRQHQRKSAESEYQRTRPPEGTDFSFHQVYYDNYFPKAYFDTNSPLSEYLKGKYGINDGESLIIWDRTIQKLRKVIWDNMQDNRNVSAKR